MIPSAETALWGSEIASKPRIVQYEDVMDEAKTGMQKLTMDIVSMTWFATSESWD